MIAPPPNVRVWLAAGVTDMRKGLRQPAGAGAEAEKLELTIEALEEG